MTDGTKLCSPCTPPPFYPPMAWTRQEDIIFERCLLQFPDGTEDRWGKIATFLPGTTPENCRHHYEDLVYDLEMIESGKVPLPHYPDDGDDDEEEDDDPPPRQFGPQFMVAPISSARRPFANTTIDHDKKKGTPWSIDEHRKFLEGLRIYGRGDWRNISRNVVITRTSTQVASHAQKYFIRLGTDQTKRKRSSIHDIPLDAPSQTASTNPDKFPSYYTG